MDDDDDAQQDVWIIMQPSLLIHIGLFSLLVHFIAAETRVLGIRILPFPTSSVSAPKLDRQLIIRCDVTAYPPVDAENNHWFYENQKRALETGKKYTIYKEPSHGVVNELKNLLTIHGVTQRQLGSYICYARNSAGMAGNATVKLSTDGQSNILIENDDYLHIESMDKNDQIEKMNGNDVMYNPDDVTTSAQEEIGDVTAETSGGPMNDIPWLRILVVSAIAIVHARRKNSIC